MSGKLVWQIAAGVALGLLTAGAIERWMAVREMEAAWSTVVAAGENADWFGRKTGGPSSALAVAPTAAFTRPLDREQACSGGTVIAYGRDRRSVVQLLEGGRPVSCSGVYRTP